MLARKIPEMAVTLEDVDSMVPKNEAGEYELTVLELFYVGNDDAFRQSPQRRPARNYRPGN